MTCAVLVLGLALGPWELLVDERDTCESGRSVVIGRERCAGVRWEAKSGVGSERSDVVPGRASIPNDPVTNRRAVGFIGVRAV